MLSYIHCSAPNASTMDNAGDNLTAHKKQKTPRFDAVQTPAVSVSLWNSTFSKYSFLYKASSITVTLSYYLPDYGRICHQSSLRAANYAAKRGCTQICFEKVQISEELGLRSRPVIYALKSQ